LKITGYGFSRTDLARQWLMICWQNFLKRMETTMPYENPVYIAMFCTFMLGWLLGLIWAWESRQAKEARQDDMIRKHINYAMSEFSVNLTSFCQPRLEEIVREKTKSLNPIVTNRSDIESALSAVAEATRGKTMAGTPNGCIDEILAPYSLHDLQSYVSKRRAQEKRAK
jgi:hypothetical protein